MLPDQPFRNFSHLKIRKLTVFIAAQNLQIDIFAEKKIFCNARNLLIHVSELDKIRRSTFLLCDKFRGSKIVQCSVGYLTASASRTYSKVIGESARKRSVVEVST